MGNPWRRRVCRTCYNAKRNARRRANPNKPTKVEVLTPRKVCQRLTTWAKSRSRRKGLECSIQSADVLAKWEASGGTCALTGLPFAVTRHDVHKKHPHGASLDRIDPHLGYTIENTRLVLWIVNSGMMQYGEAAYLAVAEALTARQWLRV
jgi:hypothetical protein